MVELAFCITSNYNSSIILAGIHRSCKVTLKYMQVGGVHVTLVQLAEDWLLRSCKLLKMPYSIVAFANALKEAEQFLWGGSEMDSVSFISISISRNPYIFIL